MMNHRAKQAFYFIKYLGCRWLLFRVLYHLKIVTGFLAFKMPRKNWRSILAMEFISRSDLHHLGTYLIYRQQASPNFFFNFDALTSYSSIFSKIDPQGIENLLAIADNIGKGIFRFFSHTNYYLGFPPNWHRNIITGEDPPNYAHWSKLSDFAFGDIKVIWEPSRFAFTYVLVRAYWLTKDEKYAEWFWQLVEDWAKNNPPNVGVNWKCGQEISLRVMAWCFGLYGFLHTRATTSERLALLAKMITVSGERIEKNISYALSQRSNHGVSEALGLFTIGLLFPEFKFATKWLKLGKKLLEREIQLLIFSDGSFAMHSFNYQRFVLHACLWSMRLADLNKITFSVPFKTLVQKSGDFLYQFLENSTGKLPNYGANDGSLVLPLNNCDYGDYRPLIQALHYYFEGNRCFNYGPWDEDLIWLFGVGALQTPSLEKKFSDFIAKKGGYYLFRSPQGFLFTRAAQQKHRPSHADMLHVDIWWRGYNIIQDAGTYSYNAILAPGLRTNVLAKSFYHNVVTVDHRDQMDMVGTFLWLPWVQGKVLTLDLSNGKKTPCFVGEHNGYQYLKGPVECQRSIFRLDDDHWLILDSLQSQLEHLYQLNYLLADFPANIINPGGKVVLNTPQGDYFIHTGALGHEPEYSLVRAEKNSGRGWISRYYFVKEPAWSLIASLKSKSVVFWTLVGPEKFDFDMQEILVFLTNSGMLNTEEKLTKE